MTSKVRSEFITQREFGNHTKQITLRVIQLVEILPNNQKAKIIGHQLLQAASSIGANYRSACRRRSAESLIQKLTTVEEEADKSLYWIEILIKSNLISENKLSALTKDLNEIVNMTASSIDTLRSKMKIDTTLNL